MEENILENVAQYDQAFEADILMDDEFDSSQLEGESERPKTADEESDVSPLNRFDPYHMGICYDKAYTVTH